MIDILKAFWTGFSQPRPIALAGIFLVALAQAALLTQPFLARVDTGYLMAGPNDYGAELTSQVLRLRESDRKGATLVVHVGSSSSQEAIDDPKTLNAELNDALGHPVNYRPLFMPTASIWELGAMIDQVPAGSHGYALIEVHHGMMGNKKDLPERLVQRSETVLDSDFVEDALRKAGRQVPFRTGVGLIDHVGFYSARRDNLWRWMLRKPLAESLIHRWSTATVRPIEDRSPVEELAENYAARADANTAVLEKVIRLAQSRGLKVILLEADARPGSLADFPDINREYLAHLQLISQKMSVPIIRPMIDAGLTADDYLDRFHLWKRPSRLKYQAAFVRDVAAIIKEDERHAS